METVGLESAAGLMATGGGTSQDALLREKRTRDALKRL